MEEVRPRKREDLGGSGKRKVPMPTIVATAGLPFLRFRKPQSPYLTRVLNDKVKASRKRGQMLLRLQEEEQNGKAEDKWDLLINTARCVPKFQTTEHRLDTPSDQGSWAQAPWETSQDIQDTRDIAVTIDAMKADRMMKLMQEERNLRDAERIEDRRNKKKSKILDPAAKERSSLFSNSISSTPRIKRDDPKKESKLLYKPIGFNK